MTQRKEYTMNNARATAIMEAERAVKNVEPLSHCSFCWKAPP